jgi:hypothetical protein
MPRDRAGNNLKTARDIRVTTQSKPYHDFVDRDDPTDYYRVQFKSRTSFDVTLSELTANANLTLLDKRGNVLTRSHQRGTKNEALHQTLESGTYYLQVDIRKGETRYRLNVQGNGDRAGETLGASRLLDGSLELQSTQDYVGLSDAADIYSLTLSTAAVLTVDITDLSANADLRLLNSDGDTLESSTNSGSLDETLSRTLAAGVYYIQVTPGTNAQTLYTLTTELNFNPPVTYTEGTVLGTLPTSGENNLSEISGLVQGSGDFWWAHTDSGGSATLYAVDNTGAVTSRVTVNGATNVDWEDIAAGSYPTTSDRVLFIGDFGNNSNLNLGTRTNQTIYVVNEPAVTDASVDLLATLDIDYPNGENYDAEAMFYDPIGDQLVVITKDINGRNSGSGTTHVFTRSLDPAETALTEIDTFSLSTKFGLNFLAGLVTGADMSTDGRVAVVRTYSSVLRWTRTGNESLAEMFAKTPEITDLSAITDPAEPQGEAIALSSRNNQDFYTASELANSTNPRLIEYLGTVDV